MRRRVLAVIAALALGVTTLFGASSAAFADSPPGGALYVAVGDSEAAGTGNLPYVDANCLRSARAYPALLASSLGTQVVSAACAGATVAQTEEQVGGLAQAGALGPNTQLVTVTAGVNDTGWQSVLMACSNAGTPIGCQEAYAAALAAVAGIPQSIGTLVGQIRAAAPNARIVVTGYPMLFGAVTSSCTVGNFQGTTVKFTAVQAGLVNAGVGGVNTAVNMGVGAYQSAFTGRFGHPDPAVSYQDVAAGFAGHSLCDTGSRWISGLANGTASSDRGFHPNAAGQQAWAAIVAASLH
ncbi:SGNH/GDSL hydrolase family protein [Microbacterium candidum]|uniref:SGNH/GDSL hydrolase family protein n=1 Tax=Microbacterium candidum TaxID=3041922 RepID=A0ABT7MUP0_9MICO|nr:SGNH/GDSL hydrolase family protein [Microbacterium sp. ASV49]MDL9978176.1 SGNH/GDSL hydrolase family protein [Microbacterium sp. ASV49]